MLLKLTHTDSATATETIAAITRLKRERNAVILAHNHPSGVAEPSLARFRISLITWATRWAFRSRQRVPTPR